MYFLKYCEFDTSIKVLLNDVLSGDIYNSFSWEPNAKCIETGFIEPRANQSKN